MQKFSTLSDAKALARFAHFHQKDKAGLPYIEHPLRVLAAVQAQGAQPFVQIAAVLHDVTEDTAFTADHLLDLGFSEAAVRLVRLLDRDTSKAEWEEKKKWLGVAPDRWWNGRRYVDYVPTAVEYYYWNIGNDENALMIKLADIADNTQPWRLSYLEPETQNRLRLKYEKAKWLLSPYRNPLNTGS